MQNDMRDRLIELHKKAHGEWLRKEYDHETDKNIAEYVVDEFLANGVIVPPCKVGDTVYRIARHRGVWGVLPRRVSCITYRLDYNERVVWEIFTTTYDVFGKTVFLTKEEAEQALKERENNA